MSGLRVVIVTPEVPDRELFPETLSTDLFIDAGKLDENQTTRGNGLRYSSCHDE